MKSIGKVLGAITRWSMAIIACISFAQFLLLIGVGTKRAQTLAGETLGRALLCGAVAAFWFYRNRKSSLMAAGERQILTAKDEKQQSVDPPQSRTTSGSEEAPVIKRGWDTDDALAVLYEAIAVTETSGQTTNSQQAAATSTAAQVEHPTVVDGGDIAPMPRGPMTIPRSSKTGRNWFVCALALLIGTVILALWYDKQKQERRDIEMAAAMADSLRSKQTDTSANAATQNDQDPYAKYGGSTIPQTTGDAPAKDGRRILSAPGPVAAIRI